MGSRWNVADDWSMAMRNTDADLAAFGCGWSDEEALRWARKNEPLIEELNRGHGYPDEPPEAGTEEYELWKEQDDEKQGYDLPENTDDSSLIYEGQPTLYGMAYACMLLRRERRDARRAAEDAKGKQMGERPGFTLAMPAKIAEKRVEGTARVAERGSGPASEDGEAWMQQRASFCNSFSNAISYDQERAIMLLLIGKSDRAIAEEIGVDRVTVYRWRQSRDFKLCLHKARQRVWDAGLDKVRTMVFKSLSQLGKLMNDKESSATRLRAVRMLVSLLGQDRIAPKLDEELAKEGDVANAERGLAT